MLATAPHVIGPTDYGASRRARAAGGASLLARGLALAFSLSRRRPARAVFSAARAGKRLGRASPSPDRLRGGSLSRGTSWDDASIDGSMHSIRLISGRRSCL